MNVGQQGITLIKYFENCRLNSYQDGKKIWTIGIGSIMLNNRPVRQGDTISQAQADTMLNEELKAKCDGLNKQLGKHLLTQAQYDACISFSYNLGTGAFGGSTLLKKILLNPADLSIRDEFIKWRNKGSSFEKGLTIRRLSEAHLYFTGKLKYDWDTEVKKIIC